MKKVKEGLVLINVVRKIRCVKMLNRMHVGTVEKLDITV